MCRQINYRDGFPLMEITKPELRKMLNKAWNGGVRWRDEWTHAYLKNDSSARYRDVSKILKEAEKANKEQP